MIHTCIHSIADICQRSLYDELANKKEENGRESSVLLLLLFLFLFLFFLLDAQTKKREETNSGSRSLFSKKLRAFQYIYIFIYLFKTYKISFCYIAKKIPILANIFFYFLFFKTIYGSICNYFEQRKRKCISRQPKKDRKKERNSLLLSFLASCVMFDTY